MNNPNNQINLQIEDYNFDYNKNNELRIKNIIKPYEEKIKKLQKEIMEKDFEIALLRDQIYNNLNFKNNQNQKLFMKQQIMKMNKIMTIKQKIIIIKEKNGMELSNLILMETIFICK